MSSKEPRRKRRKLASPTKKDDSVIQLSEKKHGILENESIISVNKNSSKANNAFFSDSLPMSQSGKFIPNFTSKNSARSKKLAVTEAKSLQIVQRKSFENEITVDVVKDGEKSVEEEVCGSEEVLKKMPPLRNMQKKTKRKSVVKVEGKSNVKTNQPEICDDTDVSRLIIPCLEDIKEIDESKVREFGHNDEDLSEDIENIMKETIDEICKDAINVNVDNPELVANLLDGSLAEKDSSYHNMKNNQTESDRKFDCRKENLKMLDDAEMNNESTDNVTMVVDGTTNLNTCTTFDFDILANQEISIRMDLDKSASQICTGSYIDGPGLNRPNNQELPGSDLNGSTNDERCTGSDLNGSTNQKRHAGSDLNKPTNQEKCTGSDLNGSINREGCTQSNLNASIIPGRCDESDLNGSTIQEKCSVSDLKRLTDNHSDNELDSNGLNNHNEDTNQERVVECVMNKEHLMEAFDGVPDLGGFPDQDGVPDLTDSQLILVDDDCRTRSTQESFTGRIGNGISTVHPQQQPLQPLQQELQQTHQRPSMESHSVHNLSSNQKSSFDMKIKEGSRLMNNLLSELSAINMSLIRYGREIEQLKRRRLENNLYD